jgi:hypothetical protein
MMAFRDFRKAILSAMPMLLDNHIHGDSETRPLSVEGMMLQFMMHQPSEQFPGDHNRISRRSHIS